MRLPTPIYLAEITDTPRAVFISDAAAFVRINPPPCVKVEDTDQLIEIFARLNKMRKDAEERRAQFEGENERLKEKIEHLKAVIYDRERGIFK